MIFNPVYGGASAPNLGSKTITANGTYLASSDNLDGYDEVTANVPNTYAAGDEGKVVSNGALVGQSSATYTSNNTYDTTLINSVTVNVSGGGGSTLITKTITANGTYNASDDNADGYSEVTVDVQSGDLFGTTTPTSSQGNNGDYYYKYVEVTGMFPYDMQRPYSSNTLIYGNEFTPKTSITVTALKARCNEARTGVLRIGNTSTVLATTANASFPAGTWVTVPLDTPITLTGGTNYIVQIVVDSNYSSGKVAYAGQGSMPTSLPVISRVRSRYGGYPGSTETNTWVNVDVVANPIRYVTNQYRKSNGSWAEFA